MNDLAPKAFAAFVRSAYGELLRSIGRMTGADLAVLDADKRPLLATQPPEESEGSAAPSPGRVSIPITHRDEPVGEIVIGADQLSLRQLAHALAANVETRFGLEEESEEMIERLSQAYSENNLLCRFADLVRADAGLPANASRLLKEFADVLDHRLAVASCPEEKYLAWAKGPAREPSGGVRWLLEHREILTELRFIRPTEAGQPEESQRNRHVGTVISPSGPIHYVLTPINARRKLVGYVGLFRAEEEPPLETGELRLLECLGLELTRAATTEALYEELRRILFSVVKSLVAAIEAKDEYTRGHSERVHDLSAQLGAELGLSADERQALGWAAVLHDIGKIAIDGSILNSTTRLTQDEATKIKTHPDRGCKVLEPISQFAHILPGIRHHHERFDGSGYPDGLKGSEIPFIGRIIAVADTFDAITSARSYRGAKPSTDALKEILACSGTQFDPEVVHALEVLSARWIPEAPRALKGWKKQREASMQVRVTKLGVATYLVPDGAMIENNLQPLRDSAQTAIQGGASNLVLDLRRVPLLDSRGLEFLLDLSGELRKTGGMIRIANANTLCRDILAITRTDQAVPTLDSLESAAGSFL